MKIAFVVFLFAVCCQQIRAEETNLTLTASGVTYSNVVFVRNDPYAVTIRHSTGIASIPLSQLPSGLQQRFGYDQKKASEYWTAKYAVKVPPKAKSYEDKMADDLAEQRKHLTDEQLEEKLNSEKLRAGADGNYALEYKIKNELSLLELTIKYEKQAEYDPTFIGPARTVQLEESYFHSAHRIPSQAVPVINDKQSDPVASLKQHVQYFEDYYNTSHMGDYDNGCTQRVTGVGYDVKKTDSLISPFDGFVTYISSHTESNSAIKTERKIELVYQDNHWVVNKLSFRGTTPGISGDWVEAPSAVSLQIATAALGIE